jgi:hypothetical protein
MEDWTEKRDILRRNPSFHGNLRHDYALVNTDNTADLTCVRLYDLFTCKTMDSRTHDIALGSMLKPSAWKPNIVWDNCRVYGEPNSSYVHEVLHPRYLHVPCIRFREGQ